MAASAPGKLILFGEHAVVFGEPALCTAINLRAEVFVRPHKVWRADGGSIDEPRYRYVKAAIVKAKVRSPMWVEVRSMVPSGAGLGSSAAVTVATLGALHGGALLVLREPRQDLLWTIERDTRRWCLHRASLPDLDFVIGNTGVSAATGPLVAKVKERVDRDAKAAEMVREIGRITLDGLAALRRQDLVEAGRLMDRDHALLTELGVGHPLLDRLIAAARPSSYGAKLTGAGGGGSIVALTDRPEETAGAIRAAGGKAFVVRPESVGVTKLP